MARRKASQLRWMDEPPEVVFDEAEGAFTVPVPKKLPEKLKKLKKRATLKNGKVYPAEVDCQAEERAARGPVLPVTLTDEDVRELTAIARTVEDLEQIARIVVEDMAVQLPREIDTELLIDLYRNMLRQRLVRSADDEYEMGVDASKVRRAEKRKAAKSKAKSPLVAMTAKRLVKRERKKVGPRRVVIRRKW